MDTDFFNRYGKIINGQHLLEKSRQLGEEGRIDYPFIHNSTLRRKINGSLDNLTVGELHDLAFTLKQAGIKSGHQSLSGQQVYENLDIIKIKPFMEFALLDQGIWDKIKNGKPLNSAEKKQRNNVKKLVQRIYDGKDVDISKKKKLAEAMNKIAADL